MNAWLEENAQFLAVALAGASALFFVLAIVFLILWLRAARARRRQYFARVDAERDQIDLEVALQEERGRIRIVRELHEGAVHSVSTIISQADGAGYVAETDPGAAARSAAVIAETARGTLADLRRVMTVVGAEPTDEVERPQFSDMDDLIRVMRDAGLDITSVESGQRFDLQEGAQLAIFRILQEALSNALKYGGPGTQVKVSITWTDEGLQLLVDDDGVRSEARRQGLDPDEVAQKRTYTFQDDLNALTEVVVGPGITEMRERASLFRGVFNAHLLPGVGFSVSAVFPAIRYDNGVHGVKLDS
ncbi:histidine kinase [Glaciihabitans sp. UYNi722]|uniref:sensor histidine kinase n=1 Tax=Glaciihabitans sp. UYNi722 TaxID=3156344 RepID=UPI003390C744